MLVVHEDDDVRRSIEQAPQDEGYRVVAFHSPQAFLDSSLPGKPPCVVFGMPNQELTVDDLQGVFGHLSAETTLVVVCDRPSSASYLRARSGRRFQVLAQPIQPEALLTAVRSACHRLRRLRSSQLGATQ